MGSRVTQSRAASVCFEKAQADEDVFGRREKEERREEGVVGSWRTVGRCA